MVMVSKFSNFPDELTENDELREFELSGSDCTYYTDQEKLTMPLLNKYVKPLTYKLQNYRYGD